MAATTRTASKATRRRHRVSANRPCKSSLKVRNPTTRRCHLRADVKKSRRNAAVRAHYKKNASAMRKKAKARRATKKRRSSA